MGRPSIPTVKRLFALSGNRCAFPACKSQLVDITTGKVVGEICHIKADSPGGSRYDAGQLEEERQGFGNLLILCPNHHTVVDADTRAYTAERLYAMKTEHESSQRHGHILSDEQARRLIDNINIGSMTNGSVIVSMNQFGGQVAHQITNVGYQPKQIPEAAIPEFLALMRSVGPAKVHITSNILDSRTQFLANQLADLLQTAGWDASGDSQSLYGPDAPRGILFVGTAATRESLSLDILAKCLKSYGFTNYYFTDEGATLTTIAVIAV